MPYSSMYHPMPFTAFNDPGMRTGFPASSRTAGPVMPSRFLMRPASRMSKAMALALRLEVVFKLMLYAMRKSRAPTAVAPVLLAWSLNSAGPKSGAPSSVANLANPSYCP